MEDEESYKLWFQEFVNCEEDFYAGDNENEDENIVSTMHRLVLCFD